MYKKIFYLFCFFLVSNCAMPNSAFLGPIYTGAKTGSIYQTSLSYSSGKIIKRLRSNDGFIKKSILSDTQDNKEDPKILLTYKIDSVEFSNIIEPEPLP